MLPTCLARPSCSGVGLAPLTRSKAEDSAAESCPPVRDASKLSILPLMAELVPSRDSSFWTLPVSSVAIGARLVSPADLACSRKLVARAAELVCAEAVLLKPQIIADAPATAMMEKIFFISWEYNSFGLSDKRQSRRAAENSIEDFTRGDKFFTWQTALQTCPPKKWNRRPRWNPSPWRRWRRAGC